MIGDMIPNELYGRIDNRWKYVLKIEKEMRGSTLATLMLDFGLEDISEALERYRDRLVQKRRAIYVLTNNLQLVDEESEMI